MLLCCFFSVQMQGLPVSCFEMYFTSQLSCIKRPQYLDLKHCVNSSGFIAGSLVFRLLVKARWIFVFKCKRYVTVSKSDAKFYTVGTDLA